MGQDLRTNPELVAATTRACIELADELACASLALPAFGTGVGGLAIRECARVMVAEARAFRASSVRRIVFAVFGADAAAAFAAAVAGPPSYS
jgi:O-acetyl-ADP-ribose deacetylase (regulator of RNase III)